MATIITKNSQTASAVPAAASLSVGELAVNTADGKLYTEHTGGVVKEIIPSTVVDGGITTAKIADGAIATADLANSSVTIAKLSASGTPSSSTYLRGDNTWATVSSGGVTSLNGQTGAITNTDYGSIGSYICTYLNFGSTSVGQIRIGTTHAGSGLRYHRYNTSYTRYGQSLMGITIDVNGAYIPIFDITTDSQYTTSLGLSGTWRLLSPYVSNSNYDSSHCAMGLFVRIS